MHAFSLRLSRVLITAVTLLTGCPGTGGGGADGGGGTGGCRAHKECRSGYYCKGPNERMVCGVPPREQCAASTDCGGGGVCHAISDGCSPDGVGSECGTDCTAMSCGTGFRCSAMKSCEPVPCEEGFTCPSHQRCDPAVARAMGPVHARSSGCVDIACTADVGCPMGKVCVNAICQDGTGTCREDIPVP